MLCVYRFELKAPLRVPQAISFWSADFRFDFERDGDLFVALSIAVRCNDQKMWPRVEPSHNEGVKANFLFPAPQQQEAIEIALTFFGMLSLRGWNAQWNREIPTRYWISESTREELALEVNRYEVTRKRLHTPQDFPVRLNDLVQIALACHSACALRQPLEFLQYATDRYNEHRYIEAFQYYYFAIESQYCNGLSKSSRVVDRLMSIVKLRIKMRVALKYPRFYVKTEDQQRIYCSYVSGLTAREAFDSLVRTRGMLHHHNLRSPHSWSLNNQEKFWAVATLAANVAIPQLFLELRRHMYSESVLRQFEEIRAALKSV